GTVLAVKAAEGDRVSEGQPLVVVEAMKMEHAVTAPLSGVVTKLPVRAGAQVALDAVLAVIEEQRRCGCPCPASPAASRSTRSCRGTGWRTRRPASPWAPPPRA